MFADEIFIFCAYLLQRKYVKIKENCMEEPDCILDDGAVRIFLNTRGTNDHEVSEELRAFLHYLEHTTDSVAEASGNERIQRIHNRVRKVKTNEEVGVKYMQAWEEKYYEREEGREEGVELGVELARRVFKLHIQGKTAEEVAAECGITEERVREILD